MGPAADACPAARPDFKYATSSASDHEPIPYATSDVMLYARQPCSSWPASSLPCSNPYPRLRGVWHSAQWPSAVARYAPLFHCADFAVSAAKRWLLKNAAFQKLTAQR